MTTNITKLQNDLNALLLDNTEENSEKHLVLSMLAGSYARHIEALGYGYDPLLGFYQQAIQVINNHLKEHKLVNMLENNGFDTQKLLKKVKTNKNSFLVRWEHLDFDNAISQHFEGYASPVVEEVAQEHPIFSRPFFIAFKGLRS